MSESRAKKYLKSIAWFSALWGIKEFILEPLINEAKHEKQKTNKPARQASKYPKA
jgi:hypothetical protein